MSWVEVDGAGWRWVHRLVIPTGKSFTTTYHSLKNNDYYSQNYRKSHQRCHIKKVVLKISQNSQESICVRTSGLKHNLKKDSDTGVFLQILSVA